MGKRSKKRPSEGESKSKNKKARIEKEDAETNNDEQNENGEKKSKNRKKTSKERDSNKQKPTKTKTPQEHSDESSAESESEDEILSKVVKGSKASSVKDKQKGKNKTVPADQEADKDEVEAITSHKQYRAKRSYLLKWKDNLKGETWVSSQKAMYLCRDMLNDYTAEVAKRNEIDAIISHQKDKKGRFKYLIKWKDTSRGETWETTAKTSLICPKFLRQYNDELENAKTNQVEAIKGHKLVNGRSKYFIKWKDHSKENSWETARKTMSICPDILDSFTEENPDCIPKLYERVRYNYQSDPPTARQVRKKRKETVVEEFDEDIEWEVAQIVDVWIKKDKSREFLIRWKGYSPTYDSWEAEQNLNSPDLIEKYMDKIKEAKSVTQKELRPLHKPTDRFVNRISVRPKSCSNRSSKRHDGKPKAVYIDTDDWRC